MTQHAKPQRVIKALVLRADQIAAVKDVADEAYEGNFSQAVRMLLDAALVARKSAST